MESKHDTALEPKDPCITANELPPQHREKDMYTYPVLLCSCIVSMFTLCHSRPLPADGFKNFVRLQAENINSRIQKHKDELPFSHNFHKMVLIKPELLPDLPSDKAIDGLGSMVDTLSTFQKVLHSLPKGHVSQLHRDVSTLQGVLEDRMSSLQCAHRTTSSEKSLDAFLMDNRSYHITLSHVALDRLQKYLQKLVHNLEKLKIC